MEKYTLQKGLTLIELLLVIALVGIITTIGLMSFASYGRNQKVVQAQGEVITAIAQARSQAQSQIKPPGCIDTLSGYRIRINFTTYEVSAHCGLANIPVGGQRKLPKNVNFDNITSGTIFQFDTLTGRVDEALATGTTFTVTTSGATPKSITIYEDGRYEAE